ncbi:MAG TPA: hypothetical protein VFD15_03290, partial [Clostridia bacterium]|nr:hypothetical protein [Clostridia bacterium]
MKLLEWNRRRVHFGASAFILTILVALLILSTYFSTRPIAEYVLDDGYIEMRKLRDMVRDIILTDFM